MSHGPVHESERAEILDVLRGFALLGIFIAHVPDFSGWDTLSDASQAFLDPGSDVALQLLRDTFVRGKFYSLFSLLFGFGFAIQYASARRRNADFASHFRRRQLGLLALGVVHSAFWHGDILLTYALLGLLLIPLADWNPDRILRLAVGALALRGLWGVMILALGGPLASVGASAVGDGTGGVDVSGSVRAAMLGYYSPEWRQFLLANSHFLRLKWLFVLYEGKLFSIAGFFLLGVSLGKWRVHERVTALSSELRRVVGVCGAIGLAGNLGLAILWPVVPVYPPTPIGMMMNLLYAFAVPALAVAMAAALSLLWASCLGRRLLSPLAPPGRMALTTYLTETGIGIGTFYGVGLGLRGSFSLTQGLALALLVFALQAIAARFWLQLFLFGPLEWAWRCFTYRRRLPFRRMSARRAGASGPFF